MFLLGTPGCSFHAGKARLLFEVDTCLERTAPRRPWQMEVLSLKAVCPLRVPGDWPRQACHQVTQHPLPRSSTRPPSPLMQSKCCVLSVCGPSTKSPGTTKLCVCPCVPWSQGCQPWGDEDSSWHVLMVVRQVACSCPVGLQPTSLGFPLPVGGGWQRANIPRRNCFTRFNTKRFRDTRVGKS